eukprot:m.175772 g.175772  ORF g.175772 m.175772 type:complete len:381 (+) comp21365_c1_seq3:202-1344(+)
MEQPTADEAVAEALSELEDRSKTEIDLARCQLADEHLGSLCQRLRACLHIEKLDLCGNRISDAGVGQLAELLQEQCPLRELRLDHNNITDKGVARLAKALRDQRHLAVLSLSYNPIGNDGAHALCEALSSSMSLRQLRLYRCRIMDEGVGVLCSALVETSAPLQLLDLGGNGFLSEGTAAIALLLRHSESLTTLALQNSDIRHDDDILSALSDSQALQVLDLRKNKVGDGGCVRLADYLTRDSTLHSLDLQSNKITSKGLQCLLGAVAVNDTLQNLNLQHNELTEADSHGLELLAAHLRKNQALARLRADLDEVEEALANAKGHADAVNRRLSVSLVRQDRTVTPMHDKAEEGFDFSYWSFALGLAVGALLHASVRHFWK